MSEAGLETAVFTAEARAEQARRRRLVGTVMGLLTVAGAVGLGIAAMVAWQERGVAMSAVDQQMEEAVMAAERADRAEAEARALSVQLEEVETRYADIFASSTDIEADLAALAALRVENAQLVSALEEAEALQADLRAELVASNAASQAVTALRRENSELVAANRELSVELDRTLAAATAYQQQYQTLQQAVQDAPFDFDVPEFLPSPDLPQRFELQPPDGLQLVP
ncbi:hypothetical protein HKCCE2091_15400 [Rhodobacterales bacterium HKCCE2091]|nr:hypothetical protein [Rhodobacterales bacterium HKCCE2091]